MKWGDTQNLLSVIIGLNIAYYAFKEMRAPHLNALKDRVDALEEDLRLREEDLRIAGHRIPHSAKLQLDLVKLWSPISDLKLDVHLLLHATSGRKFENVLGVPAIIIGCLGILLLVISTVKFDDELSQWLFYTIAFIGLAPVALLILLNYTLLWFADRKYGDKCHEYWSVLHLDFDTHLDDYRLVIAEERYKAAHSKQTP